ncbi:hypothetical protein KDW54_06680 [Burkholderia ambifaria]|uniref:hypothetical protein n=1 Tax=Burkholderia ambifaria TaxID=152480 RepID=UPI001B941028|nr:hypothetical protein [Burkholderia ambifaria]MBR8182083.1 hypothetical protein [Burkholderia ambifaria]
MRGDQADIYNRLLRNLPPWFGDDPPIFGALLHGIAYGLSFVYSLISFAKLQTRIKTATGGWLDLIAADFFGTSLPRKTNETDAAYLTRIVINLFRERGTRNAVTKILTDLTGNAPLIIEPRRPLDTGGYSIPTTGYNINGAYGSLVHQYQAFITAYRPSTGGIPYVAGYGSSPSGYSTASYGEYASLASVQSGVTDGDIYAAIASVIPAGTIAWVCIQGARNPNQSALDFSFVLDQSPLL